MAVTTWAAAILDPRVPIHWLLTLSNTGMPTARFSDADREISSAFFLGALQVQGRPRLSVNPFSARASACTARVQLLPICASPHAQYLDRPCDLSTRYGVPWKAMTAKLSRWAEGTPITEEDVIIDGHVESDGVADDGTLSLTISDSSLLYDRKLPLYRISEKWAWAGCREEDKAQGFAILYGTFSRVPCPVISAAANSVLIAHGHLASLTELYLADAALGGESFDNTPALTTRGGVSVPFSWATAGTAIGSGRVAADGTGYKDDADGTYSGAALALLTHPADQLRHLAVVFAAIPAAQIDAAAFIEWRQELPGAVGAVQVLASESTTFFQIAQDLGRILRSAIYFERGLLTPRRLKFDRLPAIHLREDETLLAINSVEGGSTQDLLTRLTVKHGWGWKQSDGRMDWLTTTVLDDYDSADFARNLATYGPLEEEIECRHVASAATITTQIAALGELHGKSRQSAEVLVSRDAHALRIYDAVQITASRAPSATGTGWSAKPWVVTGMEYGTNDDVLTLLEAKP